ncbi:hypothetical protein P5W99_36155 [Paraburkholderia sp. A3BS-1L]|uniref:hypothetical protein n=1 Tax=Paraburkholderia sp. A3BS-1L TaxID=3028375 RepID=UPI003DA97324
MFNTLIEQFKAAQVSAAEAYDAVARAEAEALPGLEDYMRATKSRHSYKTERELGAFCSNLADALVHRASRAFAPPGGSLRINRGDELHACNVDIGKALEGCRIPDLDAFWAHLERKFAGGAAVAYEQAARAIIDGFYLKPTSEMKRTSSGVVIDMSVQSEARWSGNGQRSIGVYSTERVGACFRGIATFARKSGFAALANELQDGRYLREDFKSRDKLTFSGLDVTRYNDKWQCRFAFGVGEALSLFISEFGAQHLASRGN